MESQTETENSRQLNNSESRRNSLPREELQNRLPSPEIIHTNNHIETEQVVFISSVIYTYIYMCCVNTCVYILMYCVCMCVYICICNSN